MKERFPYRDAIAIGSDHYNTLWLVRALGMAGFEPTAIIVGACKEKSFVGKSKYCKQCFVLKQKNELLPLLQGLQFSQKTVILTSGDVYEELLDQNFDLLSDNYYLCNVDQKQNGVRYWMDKRNQLERARKCGLKVPFSKSFDLNAESNDFTDVIYPALIKPEVSAGSTKNAFRICHNEGELREALNEVKYICSKVVVQEKISHEAEYLLYGVSLGEEVIIPGGDYKLISCTDINNLGMHVYGYVTSQHPEQFKDIDCVKEFVKSIGYKGIFSVELMLTQNDYCFLEINFRNDGTSYLFTQAGVNIPAIWAASCYGYDLSVFPKEFIRDKTYGLNEVNYLKYGLKKEGFIKSIKNVRRTKAFSLCMKGDMKPSLYKVIYNPKIVKLTDNVIVIGGGAS